MRKVAKEMTEYFIQVSSSQDIKFSTKNVIAWAGLFKAGLR